MNIAVDVNRSNSIVWKRDNGDDEVEEEEEERVRLPPSTFAFTFQTAGHVFGQGKSKAGILLHEDNSVLKLVLDPERAKREQDFYEAVFNDTSNDPTILGLRSLVPRYLGVFTTRVSGQEVSFLKLENLTLKFRKPSIMDVKIGFITYDPEASVEKIKRSKDKYISTKTKGFCIPGMKVYDRVSKQYEVYDKNFGKHLTDKTIKGAIIKYLGGRSHIDPKVVKVFLNQLNRVRKWFMTQQQFAFYSSSLLFIYESSTEGDEFRFRNGDRELRNGCARKQRSCDATQQQQPSSSSYVEGLQLRPRESTPCCCCTSLSVCSCGPLSTSSGNTANDTLALPATELRMIDFAHVFPATDTDHNYLSGLDNLIKTFYEISNELEQLKFYTL